MRRLRQNVDLILLENFIFYFILYFFFHKKIGLSADRLLRERKIQILSTHKMLKLSTREKKKRSEFRSMDKLL